MNLNQIRKRQRGFTLIELMLVIAIMAVLATMALAVMASATDDAKASATQARISKIEAMLQSELENYEVRRLPISLSDLKTLASTTSLNVVRNLKRQIIADLLNAEFPRPDIDPMTNDPIASDCMGEFPSLTYPFGETTSFDDWLGDDYSGLRSELRDSKYDSAGILYWRKFNPVPCTGSVDLEFNNFGEYLYESLSRIDVDGTSGVEALGNAAIGNSDDDQYPEIVDAWGNPLQLRILQVDAVETPADSDVWVDVETNWNNVDPVTAIPEGYVILNPQVPRSLDKIRFQVFSRRLSGLGL